MISKKAKEKDHKNEHEENPHKERENETNYAPSAASPVPVVDPGPGG